MPDENYVDGYIESTKRRLLRKQLKPSTLGAQMKYFLLLILIFIFSCEENEPANDNSTCQVAYYYPEGETVKPNRLFYSDSVITFTPTSLEVDFHISDSLRQDILDYVDDLSATVTCECSVVAIGYQPWGDTWKEYLLISTLNVEPNVLISKVRYHRAFAKSVAEYYDLGGTGPYPFQPGVQIVDSKCAFEY